MEEEKRVVSWLVWALCGFCASVVGTIQSIETGKIAAVRDSSDNPCCSAEHALISSRYLRQCKKALDEAAKYPAHEVDYKYAQLYLTAKLRQHGGAA